MSISPVYNCSVTDLIGLQNVQNYKQEQSTEASEICDGYSESDDSQKFNEIVSKYDITNMTRAEYEQMSQELFKNGLIKFKITCTSTEYSNTPISKEIPENIDICGWEQSTNANVKMNYLEGLKKQAEWNKEFGEPKFQSEFDEIVDFAEKVKYFQDNV